MEDVGDLSIDKLLLPALSGSTFASNCSHWVALVSGVCGSSVCKLKSER